MNADTASVERDRLASQLQKGKPSFVKNFSVALEDDLDGDPAARIQMIVADDEVEGSHFPQRVEEASTWIAKALIAAEVRRWPYISFRGESEVDSAFEEPANDIGQ